MAARSAAPTSAEDRAWAALERLAAIDRGAGSSGEREAAQLLAAEFECRGARTRVEDERVHGTYWIPIGLACGAATVAGGLARAPGAALGLLAGASVADDLAIGRRPLRRLVGHRVVHNVIGEYGPSDGIPTLVIYAHHDAAHTGLVFHPGGAKLAARLAGGLMERIGGTPAPMWGAVAGPVMTALGQMVGSRRLRRLGTALAAGYAAAMFDIWRSPAVPGANDNLSGVTALLVIADALRSEPPKRVRVVLLSTGCEESFLEAMVRFGERHFPLLPRDSTTFLCLESVASPQLMLLSAEGLLRRRGYPQHLIDLLTRLAEQERILLREPFSYRLATDGQVPSRAGYPTAVISSMDWYKAPSNYHWPSDRPENLHRENIWSAARLALAFARALDG